MLAAGCTTSTAPRTTTTTAPVSKTVSRADMARFVGLAHEGLREPFEAAFRHLPPEDRPDFSLWYEPTGAEPDNSSFVYEAAFAHGTFRFIKNRSGDYECLRASPSSVWRCVGPFGPQSIGQFQQVDGYRLPIFAAGEHHHECGWPAHPVSQDRSRAPPVVPRHRVRGLSLSHKDGTTRPRHRHVRLGQARGGRRPAPANVGLRAAGQTIAVEEGRASKPVREGPVSVKRLALGR